jgi:hypothetical protein
MRTNHLTAVSLAAAVAAAALAASAAPAKATPASPGACNMINAAPQGVAGMGQASEQGFTNMIQLVVASLRSGCTP